MAKQQKPKKSEDKPLRPKRPPSGRAGKTPADKLRDERRRQEKEYREFVDRSRAIARELPTPDLIVEVKSIGKGTFRGTRFDREAVLFEFIKRFHLLAEESLRDVAEKITNGKEDSEEEAEAATQVA